MADEAPLAEAPVAEAPVAEAPVADAPVAEPEPVIAVKPKRAPRKKKPDETADSVAPDGEMVAVEGAAEADANEPRRGGWWQRTFGE